MMRALIAAALLLAATPFAARAATPAPVVIPVDLPLTGSGSFFGKSQADILKLYEKRVNATGGIHGAPLHFEFLDDQSNPQVAVALLSSAVTAKPPAFLGPGFAAGCAAVAPLIPKGPVMYCLSPAMMPPAGGFAFAGYISTPNIELATVRYFSAMGWHRVGLIATTDTTGENGLKGLAETISAWPKRDVELVDSERFNPTDVSVAAQIAKLKSARPQVVVVFTAGAPFGTVLRGLSDAGLDVPVDTSSANTTPQQMAQYDGILPKELIANGSIFDLRNVLRPGPLKDACDELQRMLDQNGGGSPGATELYTWDAAKLVVYALRALPPGASAGDVRNVLFHLHGFAGVNGMYDFRSGDQHGLTDGSMVLSRWDRNKKAMVAVSRQGGTPLR